MSSVEVLVDQNLFKAEQVEVLVDWGWHKTKQ